MNPFHTLPLYLQWCIALLLLALMCVPGVFFIKLVMVNFHYYFLFPLFVPIMQFALAPLFTLVGWYTYYSPMLLGYLANNKQIDLHNGTTFDYLMVMRGVPSGIPFRNRVMKYHLDGLLHLINNIEKQEIADTVSIIGTSYFFNARTLAKLGFEMQEPTSYDRINLLINVFDLIWMYSLAKGKPAMPAVWSAKKAHIKGAELVKQKAKLQALQSRL